MKSTRDYRYDKSMEPEEETLARDIMATDIISISEDLTLEEALKILVHNRLTALPVVEESGAMVGIITDFDIMIQMSAQHEVSLTTFQEKIRFSKKPVTVPEEATLDQVLNLLIEKKMRRVPVVDHAGKLTGIISRRDIMKLFFYRSKLG